LPDGSRPPDGAVVETAAGFYMMSNGSGVKVTPTSVTTSDGSKVTGYNAGGTTYMLGGSRPTMGSTVHTSDGDYLMMASGGVKVGSGFGLRPPDYATLTIGGGIPQYGIQLQIIEDSYGGWYLGAGRSWNQKGISASGSMGYINQSKTPTPAQCVEFNSGQTLVAETSYFFGVAETKSLNNNMSGTAAIFSWTPQADVTISHSVYLGNPRQAVVNLYNKIFK
jgi:hypothetical protein